MSSLVKSYNYPLDLVLLVDDDDTTNYLNERLLREMQVAKTVLALKNGQEALEYLNKAKQPGNEGEYKIPDLIFLDIKMPVMDGFAFLDKYHQVAQEEVDPIIILMLTSSASFYDLERLKSYSKVKKHFSKALTKYDVDEIMREFFKKKK
ncbi:response regulator [Pontibacter chinhatensis]|uniref:CheY chemotaxis protein or a CheY-like REC (Receiver) domain n=1 Tax=Pontibacter chinhatensis TaxID=1436961 RepID=A0A1I2P0V9_9BACT|nr:response regulator [Pontibacter chinhatensis]SFG09684.1 CheY chemotaxis protein or a CheY-like REC (receiver) domain [Pontibacter chinhatensis]